MRLTELKTGEKGYITKVLGHGAFRKRIVEMGFIKGKEVEVVLNAPLKDPIKYKILGYEISLRRNEADLIEIIKIDDNVAIDETSALDIISSSVIPSGDIDLANLNKTINVALVGNPNSGKSSLFNILTGAKQHVGNYSGVTVDATLETITYKGYTLNIYDLPGTYSLTAYTPEERYVRHHITSKHPDLIVNILDSTNLERNLFLTTQLMDMDQRVVLALNMFDEFEKSSAKLDTDQLATLLGMPIVKCSAKYDIGVTDILESIISVFEERNNKVRHIHVNHGPLLEKAIKHFNDTFKETADLQKKWSPRYMAIKFIEGDKEMTSYLQKHNSFRTWENERADMTNKIEKALHDKIESALTDAKYAYIAGALRETYTMGKENLHKMTKAIDEVVTSKVLGYPIFFALLWLMFHSTFSLGSYPMELIELGVEKLASFVSLHLNDGMLRDLLVDGIIGGVGGVIIFLPNILILYFFISFMEDSGYMARVAFIMDKLMHKIGLHGKSFIPLVMGFGCTVPSVMASRTIEDSKSRLITILINPLISCSARLPIYILIVGTFFPTHATMVLMLIYCIGIILSVIMAKLLSRYFIKGEDSPFVMELPPYRIPTFKNTAMHMWEKARSYISKMGGVILLASVIIWFLGYFPRNTEVEQAINQQKEIIFEQVDNGEITKAKSDSLMAEIRMLDATINAEQQKHSYIGRIGIFFEPVFEPLGFNWKINVALLSGVAAKEIIVSTLGVLYTANDDLEEVDSIEDVSRQSLSHKLRETNPETGKPDFTPLVALSFLAFVLSYFPCIATISAIIHESGSVKWGLFTVAYTTALAWVFAFIVYQVGSLFI